MQRVFYYLFAVLFFVTPLILWPFTSEVFEFNKMILVYAMTTVFVCLWTIECVKEEKFIFRRTLLDIPLLIFLGSQFVSTFFSIDPHTSIFGYYSRFNGGLLSTVSYSLLYWAFVSNISSKGAVLCIKYLVLSAVLVSAYGILEHFGIDKNIWVQDVQNRVFSTLGQPNWLAAYLVALLPIIFRFSKSKIFNYLIVALFFITLLFTKSRSGLLGFVVADTIYWCLLLLKRKRGFFKSFIIYHLSFIILFFVIGSPFRVSSIQSPVSSGAPALETGGTESGNIRRIVWKGAIEIWRNYPILGTGPETFAYAYPRFRPIEHNLVSEWDFIYNKAHNEYLNLLANTGIVGLLSYLILVFFSIIQLSKNYALLAGYFGLLVTNFFGFSVVPTQLLLFLFPAFALALNEK